MSTIAAILGRGSHRPTSDDIHALLAPGLYAGGSPPEAVLEGPCAVGASVVPITHEDTLEGQPVVDGPLRVAFAGRLDNREELTAWLGLPGSLSDARIVARAYQRWGRDCPQWLVGSFALVVWDSERQNLFGATDHLAARPLYYADLPDAFLVASTIRQLRDGGRVPRDLDEAYLLTRLAVPVGGQMHSTRTPYIGIGRVLPGSAFVVELDRQVRTWRYWRPEELPEAKGTIEEFGTALRERLEIAVRAQCRTRGKVMCTLSGGLDSSGITGLVARMARESTLRCQGFEAVSIVFEGDPDADEREYRLAAERHFGIQAVQIPGSDCWHFHDIGPDGPAPPADEPYVHYAAYAETRQFAAAAQKTDCNVVLFGHGSDEILAGTDYFLADLIRRGRFGDAAHHLRGVARRPNRTYASAFSQNVLHPVWAALRPGGPKFRRPRARAPFDHRFEVAPPGWLRVDRRRWRSIKDVYREMTCVGVRPYARARDIDVLRSTGVAAVMNDSVFYPLGLEMRNPFLDRRVVELVLTAPAELKTAIVDGERWTKLILREAMRDVLPPIIRERRTKGRFAAESVQGLTTEWSRIFNGGHFELAARGYVDDAVLVDTLRASRLGHGGTDAYLTATVVAELWLRSQASHGGLHGQPETEGGEKDGV